MAKVLVTRLINGQAHLMERTVSDALAQKQLSLPVEKRNPAWRSVRYAETKAEPKKVINLTESVDFESEEKPKRRRKVENENEAPE